MPLFQEEPTGFIRDSFDPRDVWLDELLAGDDFPPELPIPPSFVIEQLPYEPQGGYPFCVSFAASTMLEYLLNRDGMSRTFSQPHLFYHAGGTKVGSTFRNNLDVLRNKGAIPYTKYPMPNPKIGKPDGWFDVLAQRASTTPFEAVQKLKGYARVIPEPERLKRALMTYGPLLVGVSTKGGYYDGNAKRVSSVDNHAVLLVGWTPTHWQVFDSLWWVEKKGGYGTVNIDYTFNSAYAITELPDDWKEIIDEQREEHYQNALNHYGKPRDFEAEQRFTVKMLDEFEKFNNQSVLDAAGRFWTVLINAGVYGGYSLTYTKFGVWQPGDIINDIYNWRRTGLHIFDFNQIRKV